MIPAIDPVRHPEQRQHEQARLGGTDLPRPRGVLDDRAHRPVVPRLATHDVLLQARGQATFLAEEDGEEGTLGDHETHVVTDHLAQLLGGRQAARADRRQPRLRQRHRAVKDRGEQVFLRAEMPVHRRLRHPEAPREVVEGGGAVASRAEQLGGGGEDLGPHERAPGRRCRAHAAQWWQATQSSGARVARVAFSRRWQSTHQPIVSGRCGGCRPTRCARSLRRLGPVSPPTTGIRSIGP